MNVFFTPGAIEDFEYWKKNDEKIYNRIVKIIQNIKETPFKGIGKPEPLKENLTGYWSRRINIEHRLVYKISGKGKDQLMTIIQCRYHY